MNTKINPDGVVLTPKPYCPDYHNCPGWIQGYGCDFCDYQPDTRDQLRKMSDDLS